MTEPNLTGVPETMLWTLHTRASEARKVRPILRDPDAVRIYESIDYDFERSFGASDGTHALRSRLFDEVVLPWIAHHPEGTVVELAAGLETQFQRCDNGTIQWVCIDLPESIAIRERFLPPEPRCRYLAKSALDFSWMDDIDATDVFVSAQGLLMYFEPEDVERLVTAVIERFPGVELLFDSIPPMFSEMTKKGFRKTKHYQTPVMPWGVTRDSLEPLLRGWSSRVESVTNRSFAPPHGPGAIAGVLGRIPFLHNLLPTITHVRTKR
ncbi:class I SAM-dependent methyltransferase [Smaragdicoccus niigatensis]|uniref:class I SAM-dependent methyltransferase n=1 Tax=Smaragdicoccus niigatensis TaxID=359359 RepID=UPI000371F3C9|nr:class I SAM-dependent methyltransferase [Smaragdicoccus niigatensis]